jgi:hypothetical protein
MDESVCKQNMQVQAAEERAHQAGARAANAIAELARSQQKLLAAEDAAQRGNRSAEAAAADAQRERTHAAAVQDRLERAHARIEALEAQVCFECWPLARDLRSVCSHCLSPCFICTHSFRAGAAMC